MSKRSFAQIVEHMPPNVFPSAPMVRGKRIVLVVEQIGGSIASPRAPAADVADIVGAQTIHEVVARRFLGGVYIYRH